ncbi:stalk domain-containing protein [Clostridium sp. MD294]|uniref:stalk domain-containing protein n=1 Tax=Clostridium sp. MD294 TaxID=97138 RepID=UPI0002C8CFEA|nr:stalk domain-containing protein [Clostridium sp. MD294]NDO47319.1 DUF4352 domain-containing protein [Clostridium sp. MD294]USF29612.1 hypothetical protein C820_001012 [Clostridium sp. MD294]
MKSWKIGVLGFVAGSMVMGASTVFASVYKTVQAQIMADVMFQVDDKTVASPSNQPVLNYNGYIYVPLRFTAETLECQVSFDPVMKRVAVVSPEPEVIETVVEKEVEKIVYVDRSDDPDYVVYNKLPVTVYKDGYEITLKTVMMDDKENAGMRRTRTYLKVENTDVDKISIMPYEAKLTLDDKEFDVSLAGGRWDDAWSENIREDEKKEGYILFDGVEYDYTKGSLEFQVRVNDGSGDVIDDIRFDFKK